MIGLAMMLAAADTPPLNDQVRFDLACTRAAAWGLGHTAKGTETWMSYTIANYYFLGRLTGRDETQNWVAIALAETKKKPRTDTEYQADLGACLGFLNDKLTAGLLG